MIDLDQIKERYFKHLAQYLHRPTNLEVLDKLKNSELGKDIVKCTLDFITLEVYKKPAEVEEKKDGISKSS